MSQADTDCAPQVQLVLPGVDSILARLKAIQILKVEDEQSLVR
jgi:hypothetical protein